MTLSTYNYLKAFLLAYDMEGVRWSSIRLSAANPGDVKSSSSMQAQDEHPAFPATKEVAGRLSALDIESTRLNVDSKVKPNNVVHLDTDPSAPVSPRSRSSTSGSSDFSAPSSADHAVVSIVAVGDAHAAFSTPRGDTQADIESAVPVTSPLSQHKPIQLEGCQLLHHPVVPASHCCLLAAILSISSCCNMHCRPFSVPSQAAVLGVSLHPVHLEQQQCQRQIWNSGRLVDEVEL